MKDGEELFALMELEAEEEEEEEEEEDDEEDDEERKEGAPVGRVVSMIKRSSETSLHLVIV